MGNPISSRLGDNPRGALTDIRWSISAFRELDDWVGRIDPFNQRRVKGGTVSSRGTARLRRKENGTEARWI